MRSVELNVKEQRVDQRFSPGTFSTPRRVAMPKQLLRPTNLNFLPRPEYPYSPGTRGGRYIFVSGQVAWDDRGNLVGVGDVRTQASQVLKNIESILREAGATMDDVVKCNVFLADIRYFQEMNEEFAKAFPKDPPARTTVQARLAEPEMLVEIEAIAYVE